MPNNREIKPGDQVTWSDEQAKAQTPANQMFLVVDIERIPANPSGPGEPIGCDVTWNRIWVWGREHGISADRLKVVPTEKTIPPFLYKGHDIVTVPKKVRMTSIQGSR